MKKLYALVVCLLVFALVLGSFGCAAPAPTAKPITPVQILGGRVGDPWYVFSEALAYFINHESDWLRATVVATPGIGGNADLVVEKPEMYIAIMEMTNFFYRSADPSKVWRDPFAGYTYYDKIKFIANANTQTYVWATYDENIKTTEDFAGEKVGVRRKGGIGAIDQMEMLARHGVLDKVELVRSGLGGHVANLKAGLEDVTHALIDHIYPMSFKKGAFITDMETKGPIYYVSHDPDILVDLRKEGLIPGIAVRVPPGALGKTQPEEVWGCALPVFFAADEQMDENIVYEVTRVIWESAGKWATWHPQGAHMIEEFISAMPGDVKHLHPGAKKYYDEHGIEMTDIGDFLR